MVDEFNALRAAIGELAKDHQGSSPERQAIHRNAVKALHRLSEQYEPR